MTIGPHRVKAQLGANVRRYRLKSRLSQEALALQVGLDRTYISGIERGTRNPTLVVLNRLAVGLEVPLSELVKGL